MDFEIEAFLPSQQEIMDRFGLNKNGKTQKVVDTSFIHYMRLKMPRDTGVMIDNTDSPTGGLVMVRTPYAHYMNEGILYVNPEHNSTGYPFIINQEGAHVGYKGKRVPSDRKLNYHGGPNRGAHFVERTASENFDDILREAQEEINRL